MGYDALDADCGSYEALYWAHPPGYMGHGVYLPYVKRLKEVVSIPVLTAGRMDEPGLAREAVEKGWIDMALVGRGLLADPEWADKVRLSREDDIRPCIGCHNGCLGRSDLCRPLSCAVNPACGRELEYAVVPAATVRKVMVIGGGVAGMEAARTAASAGHKVDLYEASGRLGGHLNEAGIPGFKGDERALLRWYRRQMERADNITVWLNREISAEEVAAAAPDYVVVAVGSTEMIPDLPGIAQSSVMTVKEVLTAPDTAQDYVIIGAGLTGSETALFLRQAGKEVSLVEIRDTFLEDPAIPHANRMLLKELLRRNQIRVRTSAKVLRIRENGLEIEREGKKEFLPASGVVIAAGYLPGRDLYDALSKIHPRVVRVGDCRRGRSLMDAIWDGYEVARTI
jgi:2-enoate reductase